MVINTPGYVLLCEQGRKEKKGDLHLGLALCCITHERTYLLPPSRKEKGEQRRTSEKGEERRGKEKGVPDRGNSKQPFGETILRK